MPEFGDVETGLVSFIDTPGFSVFGGGRLKEGEFFLDGDPYESAGNKYGSMAP